MNTIKKIVLSFIAFVVLMPTSFHSSEAHAASSAPFNDVPVKHWAYEYVSKMRDLGIVTGYSDNTYKPENFIRRDHVAVIFSRSLDLQALHPVKSFTDVPSNYMYVDQIKKVQQAGVFDGANGKFRPEENISRAQMAKVITNAFDLKREKTTEFRDVPSDHWANEYIGALSKSGITTGNFGLFKPQDNVSRAQFAAFMDRALEYKKQNEPTPPKDPEPVLLPEIHKVIKENKDLFREDAPINELGLINNPIAQKVWLEGMDAVRKSGLKFYAPFGSYSAVFSLSTEGYKNPAPNLGNLEFSFSGSGDNEGIFSFDFRSEKAYYLTKEWFMLAFPDLIELLPVLEKKVNEARVADKIDEDFANGEHFNVGNYRVRIGVISYKRQLENMSIEIEYN